MKFNKFIKRFLSGLLVLLLLLGDLAYPLSMRSAWADDIVTEDLIEYTEPPVTEPAPDEWQAGPEPAPVSGDGTEVPEATGQAPATEGTPEAGGGTEGGGEPPPGAECGPV